MGKVGILAVAVLVLAATGCASVRMVQREGCWIRQTQAWPNRVTEEMGPCSRQAPKWSDDRLARLVQECVALEDHRWHNRALEAWSRGQPMPPQGDRQTMIQSCLSESAGTLVTENEALKARIGEVEQERQALQARVNEDREHFRQTHAQMTAALGEAAKKPAPSAVATANSTGTARTDHKSTTPAPQPTAIITTGPGRAPVCGATAEAPSGKVMSSKQKPSAAPRGNAEATRESALRKGGSELCDLQKEKQKQEEAALALKEKAPAIAPAPGKEGEPKVPAPAQ